MSLNSLALASRIGPHLQHSNNLVLVAPVYTLDIGNQYMNFRRSLLEPHAADMGAQHSFEMGEALRWSDFGKVQYQPDHERIIS